MRWAISVSRTLAGLFVDDVAFSAAILCWLAAASLLPPWLGIGMPWRGPLLFVGLALLLGWTCTRRVARRS